MNKRKITRKKYLATIEKRYNYIVKSHCLSHILYTSQIVFHNIYKDFYKFSIDYQYHDTDSFILNRNDDYER